MCPHTTPPIDRPRPVIQTGSSGRMDWTSPIGTDERTPSPRRAQRYADALRNLPASGGGGCHVALLSVANLGLLAGLTPDQIFRDLRAAAHGPRRVPDGEIMAAVRRAAQDHQNLGSGPRWTPQPSQPAIDGAATLRAILARGDGFTEPDLWEASPIPIVWPPEEDPFRVLEAIYPPTAQLFAGGRCDPGPVQAAVDWCAAFRAGAPVPEHIIPNPLTGQQAPTKDGKPSLRADTCVLEYRCAVVEFDTMSREQQIEFFAGCRLPFYALIDSGGKSIHGWLKIPGVTTAEQWARDVSGLLFQQYLVPLGVDPACRNPARLSRMPGHFRKDSGRLQRVLFLAPGGRAVLP